MNFSFTEEQQDLLFKKFGLDKSLFEQYFLFITNTLQGNLGLSFAYNKPVMPVDANIERILARLNGFKNPLKKIK